MYLKYHLNFSNILETTAAEKLTVDALRHEADEMKKLLADLNIQREHMVHEVDLIKYTITKLLYRHKFEDSNDVPDVRRLQILIENKLIIIK